MTHRHTGLSAEISDALHAKGLPSGVPVVVHAGLRSLAGELRSRGIADVRDSASECFAAALSAAVGPDGTICVPGFYYNYARKGLTYDARTAEPDEALGKFPLYFVRHQMQYRSLNPLVNLITAGAQAEAMAAAPSLYGNGALSPWARLTGAKGWMLFFGASPITMTFVHHVEHLAGVPHLYNKIYRVPVIDMNGTTHESSLASVRYLDKRFPVKYSLDRFCRDLDHAGIAISGTWKEIGFTLTPMLAVQDFLLERLSADPFYLLESEPSFVRGVIPDDGPVPVCERSRP